MNATVELIGISRTYGTDAVAVAALRGIDLSVQPGEFVAIMGPSGSGKSTLLGILGGLDTGYSGQALIDGEDLQRLSREELARLRRQKLGFVFQDFNLVPTLTALENVALPLELDGTRPAEAQRLALAAMTRVGIPDLGGRFLEQISGGQRQRVAIARGIVGERKLILADEPTGALDSTNGDAIMHLLRGLADDGVAVVLVTHEARHAGWSDRVVFLRDGRILDEAAAQHDPAVLLVGSA